MSDNQEHHDIGAELRSLGWRGGKSQPFGQHRVGSGRIARSTRPTRPARSVRSFRSFRSARSRRPFSSLRHDNLSRVRVENVIPRPTADRSFYGYELREYESPTTGLRSLESDPQSLILAVDGAFQRNGLTDPQASFGVFVSSERPELNETGLLPVEIEQTSKMADLYSAMQAIEKVHLYILKGESFSHVVIKTNSEYMERGMRECIWKWTGNGFLNYEGKPVVNGPTFKYLHEKLELLEVKYGTKVSFCRVSREENERAGWLARLSLRGDSDSGSY